MLTLEGPPRLLWLGRERGLQGRGPECARFSSVGALFLAFLEGMVPERFLKEKCVLFYCISLLVTVLYRLI